MAVTVQSVSTTNYTSGFSINITKPTGLAVGDLLLAFISGTSNATSNINVPSGWTEIDSSTNGGESWKAMYKVADSSDVAASQFTFTNTDGEYIGGGLLRIENAAIDFSVKSKQTITNSANGVFNASTITPTVANSLILFFVVNLGNAGTSSGYAIATDNPTWIEGYDFGSAAPATDLSTAVAYANRPQTTATGNFSYTDPGTVDAFGFFLALYELVNVTVTIDEPGILTLSGNEISFTLDNIFTIDEPGTLTLSGNDHTVTGEQKTTWSNDSKPSTTWTNE